MANRYYNVCYSESIVFKFHQLLRFIITKQSVLNWRRGAAAAAPRRHFLGNLKCEYLRKERSCGAKTSMANRYYNVCYAESIVFMFHEVLRFIITKNIFSTLAPSGAAAPPRRHLAPSGATQCLEGSLKSRPRSKGKHFFDEPFEFYIN